MKTQTNHGAVIPLEEPNNRAPSNSPWRTDDPPKDGTVIVALGNITEDCGGGAFNVEPFTASISWDGDEWVNSFGMALSMNYDAEVSIHHWAPMPE